MEQHIKLFANHSAYSQAKNNLDKPNVSLCLQENEIHYAPYIPPIVDGHEYVDLGLPSGTKWATMNIGASEPTEKGCLFSWGGTNPTCCGGYDVIECGKNYFYWDTYELSTGGQDEPGTGEYRLNKYCPSGKHVYYYPKNGSFTGDSLTLLLPVDDAAIVNWSENWTLPTKEQCLELIQYTTKSSPENGVYVLTGPNGNSITFVKTGESSSIKSSYERSPSINSCSSSTYPDYCLMWTKDLYINEPSCAYTLEIVGNTSQVSKRARAIGITIRPVVKVQN